MRRRTVLGLLGASTCAPNVALAFTGPTANAPGNLKVESTAQPLNVHAGKPRLSWHSPPGMQVAYEVEAASSASALDAGEADLWRSGRVNSGRSVNIYWGGGELSSRQPVHWRVRVWRQGEGMPSDWSPAAFWRVGLLAKADWQAKWIGAEPFAPVSDDPAVLEYARLAGNVQMRDNSFEDLSSDRLLAMAPAILLRKSFEIAKPVAQALLYSTSAGYSDMLVDGQSVSTRMMNPGQTDYDKRILYDVDDITDFLSRGTHTLGIHLGNGWYGERIAFPRGRMFYGEPLAIAQLEITYEDGSSEVITSDSSWRARPSPIIKNGIFSGEVYDARKEVANWAHPDGSDGAGWVGASEGEWPTERMEGQLLPPIRAMRTVEPIGLLEPEPGVYVFDFGQNFTGVPVLNLAGAGLAAGDAVHMRFAEWADRNGVISQKSGGGWATSCNQVDTYIAKGGGAEQWRASFTWHGFRYVEVTGLKRRPPLQLLKGELVRSSVERIGDFSCSDPLVNRVHHTALWTYESNLVSVPSDCPIRERAGWTGDAHAAMRLGTCNFDMERFWDKYLGDFLTARFEQPAIVPGRRTLGRKFDWPAAEPFLLWEHYVHHGDTTLIERHYQRMVNFLQWGQNNAEGDIVQLSQYGDWCDKQPVQGAPRGVDDGSPLNTPVKLSSTAIFARLYDIIGRMAEAIGRPDDAARFAGRFAEVKSAFHAEFYDEAAGHYGSQTADGMALQWNLVPADLIATVARGLDNDVRVTRGGHYSVGCLGQTWLYPALSDNGYHDTALGIFTAKGYPGFADQFDTLGATSLWERHGSFDPFSGKAPERSLSHPFHGGYDAWFFRDLAGIRPDEAQPGFQHFLLGPCFPEKLDWVKASYRSGYGTIRSEWERKGDEIVWNYTIPENSTARLVLPGQAQNGRIIGPGVHALTISAA